MPPRAKTIDDEVAAVLRRATTEGRLLTLPLRLEPGLYRRVDDVLGRLGGEWSRQLGAHVFPGDAGDALAAALDRGEAPPRNPLVFFATPPDLAETMARMLHHLPLPTSRVLTLLEPSAGDGALIEAFRRVYPEPGPVRVTAVEADAGRAAALERLGLYQCVCDDFLTLEPDPESEGFDYILMNPPFAVEGDPAAYVTHVRHAFRFLRPGGKLVAVVSAGFTFSEAAKLTEFRNWCWEHGSWKELPDGTFKALGTGVATALLGLMAPASGGQTAAVSGASEMACEGGAESGGDRRALFDKAGLDDLFLPADLNIEIGLNHLEVRTLGQLDDFLAEAPLAEAAAALGVTEDAAVSLMRAFYRLKDAWFGVAPPPDWAGAPPDCPGCRVPCSFSPGPEPLRPRDPDTPRWECPRCFQAVAEVTTRLGATDPAAESTDAIVLPAGPAADALDDLDPEERRQASLEDYPPTHCWHYFLGGVPVPPEQIPALEVMVDDTVLRPFRARKGKGAAGRSVREKAALALEKAEAALAADVDRYLDLVARGDAALSEYEVTTGDTVPGTARAIHTALALKYSHIARGKGLVRALKAIAVAPERDRAGLMF